MTNLEMPHVLVVEDDVAIRFLLGAMLRGEGYRISTASQGEEALAQIQREAPDLIITDALMPVMDGAAFARAYRELPGPHAPIIMIAATHVARRAAEIGAAGYLDKPFDLEEL